MASTWTRHIAKIAGELERELEREAVYENGALAYVALTDNTSGDRIIVDPADLARLADDLRTIPASDLIVEGK